MHPRFCTSVLLGTLALLSCSQGEDRFPVHDDDAPATLLKHDPRSIELAGSEIGLLGSTPEDEEFEAVEGEEKYTGRCMVVLREGTGDPLAVGETMAIRNGFKLGRVFRHAFRGFSLECDDTLRDRLAEEAEVEFLSRDRAYSIDEPVNPRSAPGPARAQAEPTGIRRLNPKGIATNRGIGIHVAVVDSGIEASHPDLPGQVAGGYNCAPGETDPTAWRPVGSGHGTHVAGTIAAADNTHGVVGVAPEAKLWSLRVFNAAGQTSDEAVACALEVVACLSPGIQDTTGCPEGFPSGPIRVVNMSLGGPRAQDADDGDCGRQNGDVMHLAVCNLDTRGVTVVAAAGNGSPVRHTPRNIRFISPAAYNEVLAVTALSDSDGRPCGNGEDTISGGDDTFAEFSNYANLPEDLLHMIAAPGADILSTWLEGGYMQESGTSMASPHVAGLAALLIRAKLDAGENPAPSEIRAALRALGEPLGPNLNPECGNGSRPSHSGQDNHPGRFFPHLEPVGRADGF